MHGLGLADPVRPILRLFVHRWVPICIVKNYAVSTSQIDSDTAASRARNKAKDFWGQIEPIHHLLSSFNLDRAVQSHVCVAMQIQELLEYVEHPCHLSENQYFAAFKIKLFQQLSQPLQLAAVVLNQVLVREK